MHTLRLTTFGLAIALLAEHAPAAQYSTTVARAIIAPKSALLSVMKHF